MSAVYSATASMLKVPFTVMTPSWISREPSAMSSAPTRSISLPSLMSAMPEATGLSA